MLPKKTSKKTDFLHRIAIRGMAYSHCKNGWDIPMLLRLQKDGYVYRFRIGLFWNSKRTAWALTDKGHELIIRLYKRDYRIYETLLIESKLQRRLYKM